MSVLWLNFLSKHYQWSVIRIAVLRVSGCICSDVYYVVVLLKFGDGRLKCLLSKLCSYMVCSHSADPHQRVQVVAFQDYSAYMRPVQRSCAHTWWPCIHPYMATVAHYIFSHMCNGLKLSVWGYPKSPAPPRVSTCFWHRHVMWQVHNHS